MPIFLSFLQMNEVVSFSTRKMQHMPSLRVKPSELYIYQLVVNIQKTKAKNLRVDKYFLSYLNAEAILLLSIVARGAP